MMHREKQSRAALVALLFVGVHTAGWAQLAGPGKEGPVADFSSVRALASRVSGTNVSVQLRGIAQSKLPGGRIVFVGDGDEGALVDMTEVSGELPMGRTVLVKGVVNSGGDAQVKEATVKTLRRSVTAVGTIDRTPGQLLEENLAYRWRETEGVVRSASKTRFGWRFELNHRGSVVSVLAVRRGRPVTPYVLDAIVRFEGVTLPMKTIDGDSDEMVLWVDDWSRIVIEREPPQFPFRRSIHPIAELNARTPDDYESNRVRVRARVEALVGDGRLRLADSGGSLEASLAESRNVMVGDHVDVLGYMESGDQGLILKHAELRLLGLPEDAAASGAVENPLSIPEGLLVPVFETLKAVNAMSEDEASMRHPVRVPGIVTLVQTNLGVVFLQDSEEVIRISSVPDAGGVTPGDRVEVSGHVMPGGFGPSIEAIAIRWLEHVGPLRPLKVTTTSLLAGLHEGRLIQVDAVVRRIDGSEHGPRIKLAHGGRFFGAEFGPDVRLSKQLVGARVSVAGVASAVINSDAQAVGATVLVGSEADLAVTGPAPEKPFEIPAISIGELLKFKTAGSITRRNRIVGVVVLNWPDRIFVQDDTGLIEVRIGNGGGFSQGDEVNVLGFLDIDRGRPRLVDAEATLIGTGRPAIPVETSAEALLRDVNNVQFVSVDGRMLSRSLFTGRSALLLSEGSATFRGVVPESNSGVFSNLREGSLLQIVGVAVLRTDEDVEETVLDILMQSDADVVVLRQGPRISSDVLIAALLGLAGLILASLGWIAFLRQRMRHTESRFAKAFEATPIPVAVGTRQDQRILDVNDAFLSLFEFDREEVVGHTLAEIRLCPDPEFTAQFQSDLRQRSAVRGLQCHLRAKTGQVREALLSAEPIQFEGVDCLLFIFQDISERLELMNQLRESQKMEAVGRLAGGIAHDFNNLLTIIRGNNELLKDSLGADPDNAEYHVAVTTAANRAADLTRQLLAFSSKQVMHRSGVNLDDLIRASTRMMHRTLGEDIDIVESLRARAAQVDSDQGMLSQVILNLAVNARDAMPNGGRLTVETRVVELRADNLPEHPDARDGEFVRVSISDTGVGMDPETLSHVFEPFYTTKETGKGTGLGLSTVFGIVKQHEGWIAVTSRVGEGSRFEVFLPLAGRAGEEKEKEKAQESDAALRGTETILLVEDDAPVRSITSLTLSRHGYKVIEATDAVDARGIWKEPGVKIDLLLTDMVMPGGVSGWELVQGLQKELPNLKSVYLSGYSVDALDHGEDLFEGFNFLAKPFQTKALLKTIRARFEGKRPETAAQGASVGP